MTDPGAVLDVPDIAIELGERFRRPVASSTSSACRA